MTNEQQRSPIFCLDKLKKHLYNTIWGIKPLLITTAQFTEQPSVCPPHYAGAQEPCQPIDALPPPLLQEPRQPIDSLPRLQLHFLSR